MLIPAPEKISELCILSQTSNEIEKNATLLFRKLLGELVHAFIILNIKQFVIPMGDRSIQKQ